MGKGEFHAGDNFKRVQKIVKEQKKIVKESKKIARELIENSQSQKKRAKEKRESKENSQREDCHFPETLWKRVGEGQCLVSCWKLTVENEIFQPHD